MVSLVQDVGYRNQGDFAHVSLVMAIQNYIRSFKNTDDHASPLPVQSVREWDLLCKFQVHSVQLELRTTHVPRVSWHIII